MYVRLIGTAVMGLIRELSLDVRIMSHFAVVIANKLGFVALES